MQTHAYIKSLYLLIVLILVVHNYFIFRKKSLEFIALHKHDLTLFIVLRDTCNHTIYTIDRLGSN